MKKPQINILVPLYNEEKVFNHLIERLTGVMANMEIQISIIMVDDGSSDSTPELMRQQSLKDERFTSVFLSRNFGHQMALTAGLSVTDAAEGIFIIDGDLQDPPELLTKFYPYLSKGYDVIYAIRKRRKETILYKFSYLLFYRLLRQISYIKFPLDSGDFALLSRRVVENLNRMPEESRFLRGMRSWVGYNQMGIEYDRNERVAGNSKYSLKSLWRLASNGIFNFSEYPVKFITRLGFLTIFISGIYFMITLFKKLFWGSVPEGFTALTMLIILFGGVQLIAIGIIGEYVLRIFFQVKKRPLFIIKSMIHKRKETDG